MSQIGNGIAVTHSAQALRADNIVDILHIDIATSVQKSVESIDGSFYTVAIRYHLIDSNTIYHFEK